jgi:predicted GNAT family acetyltransferase
MSALGLEQPASVDEFEAAAGAFLASREAEHNVMLGLLPAIRAGRWPDPYFCVVRDGARVVAAALRTPPLNLILSVVDDPRAVAMEVGALAASTPDLPGVVGPKEPAGAFAALWRERTGRNVRLKVAERIFRLTRVIAPRPVAGHLRRAAASDRDRVIEWLRAFVIEAMGPEEDVSGIGAFADRWLTEPGRWLYFWDDGGPVSMCGASGETQNGIRIGAVYTPPELRGRGYASACVAAISQAQLDRGRRFCFLYTDLANPTSNKIYQAIGYEAVCDVDEYRFKPARG